MAADTNNVLGVPLRRRVAEPLEFPRSAFGVARQPVDIGVDTGDEVFCDLLGRGTIGGPLLIHISTVEKEAGSFVLLDECRAEYFRQLTQTPTAPQVDLEEPIAGRVETLGKKEIRLVPGVNVGHAPAIDQ